MVGNSSLSLLSREQKGAIGLRHVRQGLIPYLGNCSKFNTPKVQSPIT